MYRYNPPLTTHPFMSRAVIRHLKGLIPREIRSRVGRRLILPKWCQLGPLSLDLACHRPMAAPPVLLISLPRCGSSWVGEVLGLSPTAAYLREPITQSRRVRQPGEPSVFELVPERLPSGSMADLARVANRAFAGVPDFQLHVVERPAQWAYRERPHRRVVVKEINPLLLDWLLKRYAPRVIYLVRHPAAIANSYHRLGWTGPQLETRFSEAFLSSLKQDYRPFLSSFWAEHGAMQALVHSFAASALKGYEHHEVIKYEDLCRRPHHHFRQLYAFAGLEWNDDISRQIKERSDASAHDRSDIYGTVRDSRAMAKAWKQEVPLKVLRKLREAYLHFDPPYYRSAWD